MYLYGIREWIAVPTVTYIADTLLRGYGKPDGSNSTYLLDTYDVIVCPIINVDGYEYTWAEDRMWRKTRSVNGKLVYLLFVCCQCVTL